jgi:hypothetical protein
MSFDNKLEEIKNTIIKESIHAWEREHLIKYPSKRVVRPLAERERVRFQSAHGVQSVRDSENNVWNVRRVGRKGANLFEVGELLGQFKPR